MKLKERILSLYKKEAFGQDGLRRAISKGWLSVSDVLGAVGEDKSLSVLIEIKLEELSRACNAAIVSGVDLTLDGEDVHFNLSLEDQANIANLFRVVELGGTEFPYQSDGGVCRIYTAAEIAQIYIAAQTRITSQTTYHNALKEYVLSLTDADSVAAVVYGMELPEPYLSAMNAKLSVAEAQMEAVMAKLGESA